ncbi:flagellar hook-associated protein FlgK [Rhodanobacter sp. AS-Z3]|uniref:flagellar hook-associated protein FlgK n=1 Tax=Rhodanobacter sp. AS-Z3 TaxID=3031330 RepID=UPI0024783A7F|nr:flagellar hook-associated protein FlgK [Rhodanobacter sp. AS-Z3]WEN14620.1 flagellar hook-associated protein FlgK [Rhodanobacter sp. AS-Z3]
MADMLSTGVSGLLAAQVGLSTVSHNVANVNTDGYSRQLVSYQTKQPEAVGGYYVGTGVDTQAVQRAYSQFLNSSLWSASSGQGRATTMNSLTSQINNQLAGSSNLQTSLDGFYGAVQDMANTPSDAASRQVLLARAGGVVSTFHALSDQFNQLSGQVQRQITDTVGSINTDSAAIAKLNGLIRATPSDGTPPSDLLDKRDSLVKKLAGEVGVTVVPQNDNTISIFTGNGQALVTSAQAFPLGSTPNVYDATRQEVTGATTGAVISGRIGGGSLGALLEFRSNVLDPAQAQLGRSAQAMASAFNAQHAQGVDLQGAVGGTFFNVAGPVVQAASTNTGTGTLDASISNIGSLTGKDYLMRYNGTAWSMSDANGGAAVTLSGSGTAADPFTAAGLSLVIGGAASAGDSFRIQPSQSAAASFSLAINNPDKIAAAAPFVVTTAPASAGIPSPTVSISDGSNPNLFDAATVVFSSPTTYSINGGPSQTFTPGQPVVANGWSMKFSAAPQAGYSFGVQANSNAQGDNRNALMLGKVANLGVLDGGITSTGHAYSQLVSQVGSAGALAADDLTTQTAVYSQAMGQQQSVSGVNLDEEAANMVRYQQAYQASAQVISASNTIFSALLSAVRSG